MHLGTSNPRSSARRVVLLALLGALHLVGCDDEYIDDPGSPCETDAECDDGRWCTGPELCAMGQCAAPDAPCGDQICMEGEQRCRTNCDVDNDYDGDGIPAIECGGSDCNDFDATVSPDQVEVCDANGVDEDCDPTTFGDRDRDWDGFVAATCCNGDNCGTDCDDQRRSINGDGAEACNGLDDDCDGEVDEGVMVAGYMDLDGDGHGLGERTGCPGARDFAIVNNDCDDGDPSRRPGLGEVCDGVDNDCDEIVDEGATFGTWFRDLDGDGFGHFVNGVTVSCEPVEGYVLVGGDCDDDDPTIFPGATERCNAKDDDCNGFRDFSLGVNDWEDDDGDGFADAACGVEGADDCNDGDADVYPGASNRCDGLANDCEGEPTNEADEVAWYDDADGDGWGNSDSEPVLACMRPAGRTNRRGDCDDGNGSRNPGALDRCTGVDDDCDGTVDENGIVEPFYADSDGDGFGGMSVTVACTMPEALISTPGDCDDANRAVLPGAAEICNGLDDDCDGTVDEGTVSTLCPDATGGTITCSDAGACVVMACDEPFADCNLDGRDGCEANLQSDAMNCGTCDTICGGAVPMCSAGGCVL